MRTIATLLLAAAIMQASSAHAVNRPLYAGNIVRKSSSATLVPATSGTHAYSYLQLPHLSGQLPFGAWQMIYPPDQGAGVLFKVKAHVTIPSTCSSNCSLCLAIQSTKAGNANVNFETGTSSDVKAATIDVSTITANKDTVVTLATGWVMGGSTGTGYPLQLLLMHVPTDWGDSTFTAAGCSSNGTYTGDIYVHYLQVCYPDSSC